MGTNQTAMDSVKEGAAVALYAMVFLGPILAHSVVLYAATVTVLSIAVLQTGWSIWRLGEYAFVYILFTTMWTIILLEVAYPQTGIERSLLVQASILPGHACAYAVVYWRGIRIFSKGDDPSIFARRL
jgi:hypothetical protein